MSRWSAVLALVPVLGALAPLSRPPSSVSAQEVITVTSARGSWRIAVVSERGFPAVAAGELGAAAVGFEHAASPASGSATIGIAGRTFVFVLDAGYFRCGDDVYTLTAGPYVLRDSLFVPLQFVTDYLPRLTNRYRWHPARAQLEELAAPGPATTGDSRRPSVTSRRADETAPGTASPGSGARRRRVIAIDPGHGGIDQGMSGPLGRTRFLKEKDVTLAVGRAVARELQSRGLGVVMTRDRDTLIAREDRGRIAGRGGADIFVSIHVNAANPQWRNGAAVRGFETYYLAEARTEEERYIARMENSSYRFETNSRAEHGDPLAFILTDLASNEHLRESSRLAEIVQGTVERVHPAINRGVKQAPFVVLATSYMPAILIETGFGSNDAEARFLTSAAGQQQLARAIADGIERYLNEFDRRVGAGQP